MALAMFSVAPGPLTPASDVSTASNAAPRRAGGSVKSSAAAICAAVAPRAPANAIDTAWEMLAGDRATF